MQFSVILYPNCLPVLFAIYSPFPCHRPTPHLHSIFEPYLVMSPSRIESLSNYFNYELHLACVKLSNSFIGTYSGRVPADPATTLVYLPPLPCSEFVIVSCEWLRTYLKMISGMRFSRESFKNNLKQYPEPWEERGPSKTNSSALTESCLPLYSWGSSTQILSIRISVSNWNYSKDLFRPPP